MLGLIDVNIHLLIQNIVNGVLLGLVYALIALGLSLMFGVMGIINFAHGDFLMIAMYFSYVLALALGIEGVLTSFITVPLFVVIGVAWFYTLINRVLKADPLIQIAMTVGILMFLRNIALAIWKAEPRGLPYSALLKSITIGGITISLSRLIIAIISLAVFFALHLFLTRTKLGIAIRATAEDTETAALMGINVKLIYALTTGLSLGLVALAAALILTFTRVDPMIGTVYGLISWCIVAMAGLGTIKGIIFSGLIIGLVEALGMSLISPGARELFIYLTFILILWVRPRGLFGVR
ncbi:MAG TPA: branched-chain amino acid ABC transporter permease [Acidilobales archaeon]|nr:MAG: amino acid ABC transporter permease [Desulfurococcales archaeon ex4484_42]HDD26616.1 branched-chain amino acid ABC transporter permease [Acidilobales archaeon]